MAIARVHVRLVSFLHSRFQLLLYSNSWLKTLLAQCTSHAPSSLSTQAQILNFPINRMLLVSCDWILCCDWYALHGVGQQTAPWPCPRPFPWNRVWPHKTWLVVGSRVWVELLGGWACYVTSIPSYRPVHKCICGCNTYLYNVQRDQYPHPNIKYKELINEFRFPDPTNPITNVEDYQFPPFFSVLQHFGLGPLQLDLLVRVHHRLQFIVRQPFRHRTNTSLLKSFTRRTFTS